MDKINKIPNFARVLTPHAKELGLRVVLNKKQMTFRHVDCYHITISWNIEQELLEFQFSQLVPLPTVQRLHKLYNVKPDDFDSVIPFIKDLLEYMEEIYKDKNERLDV